MDLDKVRSTLMESNDFTDRLMTVKEAAEYLGYAEGTVYNKIAGNEIPHVRLGRTVRFRKSELDRWIAGPGAAAA